MYIRIENKTHSSNFVLSERDIYVKKFIFLKEIELTTIEATLYRCATIVLETLILNPRKSY